MTQYKTQYGTVFAVKEHNGSPAIMCRAEVSETWSLSSMITPFTPGAWTAEELQGQLDNWAATKGWQPVEAPASAEPPEIVDEGSGPDEGFPDWVRPMAEAFLQFPFFRELPVFTSSALRYSDPARLRQGGTLADGFYDTGPKGITFSVFRGDNSDQHREAHYTWADFVRRCKAAGLEPEPHQDKEDAPCNTEPPAPSGAAAATTDASAAPMQSTAAETTTTSASGAAASTSTPQESGISGRNSSPAPGCPAEAGDAASVAIPAASPVATPSNLPAFDYTGLDADTAEKLRGITDCVMELYQTYAWGMAYQVGRAHDLLCGDSDRCETVSQRSENGQFAKKEKTFTAWCAYIGVERRSAYNLLNAYRLICKATPEQQKNLQLAPAKLLYETGKKDVPNHLVNAVLDGDITKTKQFLDAKREWQAKLDAERAAREKAEQERDEAATHIQASRDMQIDTARERDAALRRAAEAEKQRDGARDALTASKLRGDKLKAENEALKARPIEARVVDEEEIERRAQARADELTAPMREELEALRARHPADLEEAEQAIRDAYDSAIYTGRVMENAWHTLRPLLPRMDAHRRELAINQVSKTLSQIQREIAACL